MLKIMVHTKCRAEFYPRTAIRRLIIPDDKVPWDVPFPDYKPPHYESPILNNKPWADPPITDKTFQPKWNELDDRIVNKVINRQSHTGRYKVTSDRNPLNPEGRTGLYGRGILGKWGPNHAADPIVTRWKLNEEGEKVVHSGTKLAILQFCAIQRRDCRQWAIPGGMIDPGECVNETLKREFLEEAFNSLDSDFETRAQNELLISEFFKTSGVEIYKGYVDDPRNTDNAWMETVAINFHDDNSETVGKFNLKAGDDAQSVKWVDVDRQMDLYASHSDFIEKVAELRHSHW